MCAMAGRAIVTSIVLCVGLLAAANAAPPGMETAGTLDWPTLQDALIAVYDEDFSVEAIEQSPLVRRFTSQADEATLLEMCAQGEYPFVAIAGFALVKKRYPDSAFRAALVTIEAAKRPTIQPYVTSIEELSKMRDVATFQREFSSYCLWARDNSIGAAMINEMVDFRMLYDWYHSSKRPAIRAGAEAVILSRLLARNHKEMPVTRRMTEGLQRFARVPGVARYTFVYFVDESDKKFDECMKAVLRDKSTEGNALYMLVYRSSPW